MPGTKIISFADYTIAGSIAAYIKAHAAEEPEKLSYAALTRHFAICKSRMQRGFKKQFGQSIHQYMMQVRHAAICEALATTRTPIKIIARDFGYFELSNFSRDFSKLAGVSPSSYRSQAAIGAPGNKAYHHSMAIVL